MQCQLRSVLKGRQQAIIDHLKANSVESVDDLLQAAQSKKSAEELEAWAAKKLRLQDLDPDRLANAIMDLRAARAAALQAVSEAVPSGT